MKAKQIHLENDIIKILTIDAVNNGKTFKIYAQNLLIEKANQLKNKKGDK